MDIETLKEHIAAIQAQAQQRQQFLVRSDGEYQALAGQLVAKTEWLADLEEAAKSAAEDGGEEKDDPKSTPAKRKGA